MSAQERWVMWEHSKWHRITGSENASQVLTACGAWTWKQNGHTVVNGKPSWSDPVFVCRKCMKGAA